MTKFRTTVLAIVFGMALLASCGGSDGSIQVEDARYRLARPDLGAGYLSITNTTGADVTLQSAAADGVGRIELHESTMSDDGAMTMQEIEEGFTIADGETVVLEPGGKHLMLFDPEGTDDLDLVLDFGDETIEVTAAFDAEASAGAMNEDDSDSMDDGDMEDSMDDGDMDHSMDDGDTDSSADDG